MKNEDDSKGTIAELINTRFVLGNRHMEISGKHG